jgi:hypothetical protein
MIAKVIGAVWPLVIFPILLYLTVQGTLDLGGGEKDIVIAIPMLVFTLFYIVSYIFLLKKKKRTFIALMLSAFISLLLLVVITLVFAQFLGVKV